MSKLSLCLLLLLCVNGIVSAQLSTDFYAKTCPLALLTIRTQVLGAVLREARMGASLLRLHFHDCFVQGCDGSVLLDDTATFKGEKTAATNVNSASGFEVIDQIKAAVESICPGVVSCADVLAVAARDSTVLLGGPSWDDVKLGRRDSTTASLSEANSDLPLPFFNLTELIASFAKKGLTPREMVALSGSHTLGQARCFTFKGRAYNDTNIDPAYQATLQSRCPNQQADDNLKPLDALTPNFFDNSFFRNLVNQQGLLHSDQALFDGGSTDAFVTAYFSQPFLFNSDFANAMIKMSEITPLTGSNGQIRKNCRRVN